MYYSYSCSYCTKIFYTFHTSKEDASEVLYKGIKAHLIEYDEDHKEYKFDDAPQMEISQMYYATTESNVAPAGGYEL